MSEGDQSLQCITAAYAASKAALASLTRTWAAEFGPSGVRFNTVSPGPTRTESGIALVGDDGVAAMAAGSHLARPAEPREIAEVVTFLASPRASYLTAATVAVDGGLTAA